MTADLLQSDDPIQARSSGGSKSRVHARFPADSPDCVDLSDWMVVNAGLELQAPFSSNISGFAGAVRTIQAKSGLGRISSPTILLIPPKLILGGIDGSR